MDLGHGIDTAAYKRVIHVIAACNAARGSLLRLSARSSVSHAGQLINVITVSASTTITSFTIPATARQLAFMPAAAAEPAIMYGVRTVLLLTSAVEVATQTRSPVRQQVLCMDQYISRMAAESREGSRVTGKQHRGGG